MILLPASGSVNLTAEYRRQAIRKILYKIGIPQQAYRIIENRKDREGVCLVPRKRQDVLLYHNSNLAALYSKLVGGVCNR